MRNLQHKVGDVVFMSAKASSKGKAKRGTVTKITMLNTHLTTGYCQHRFIMILPTTESGEKEPEPEPETEIIKNLAKLIIKLTEKVSSLENEIVEKVNDLNLEIIGLKSDLHMALNITTTTI